jgi:hypothetical protein
LKAKVFRRVPRPRELSREHQNFQLPRIMRDAKAYAKSYYAKRKDDPAWRARRAAMVADWRRRNPDRVRAQNRKDVKAWTAANPERAKEMKRRGRKNPLARALRNLRRRVREIVNGGKTLSTRAHDLVGCSPRALVVHLETGFAPGMTWENYGDGWHIDHRRPCAAFDLTDPKQRMACFHYSNLQPLWATDNLAKGAKSFT